MASPELLTLPGGQIQNLTSYLVREQPTQTSRHVGQHTETFFFILWALHQTKQYLKCIVYERKLKLYHSSRSSCVDNLNLQILQDHPLPGKCLEHCNAKSHFLLHSLQNLLCPTSLLPLQKIMNSLFALRASIKERPHQSPI